MIYTQNYSTPKNPKRQANTGQNLPTTLLTSLEYSEIAEAGTRTVIMAAERPDRHQNSRSLLTDMNSLFRKNFSLLSVFEFPVNFEAQLPRTTESSLLPVRFTHMETN